MESHVEFLNVTNLPQLADLTSKRKHRKRDQRRRMGCRTRIHIAEAMIFSSVASTVVFAHSSKVLYPRGCWDTCGD